MKYSKSGDMLPTTRAESKKDLGRHRESGTTAIGWARVNGITRPERLGKSSARPGASGLSGTALVKS
jgi:hypothetical protein